MPRRRQLLGQVFFSEVQLLMPLKPMDLQRCFNGSPVSCTSQAAPARVRGQSHLQGEAAGAVRAWCKKEKRS